MKPELKPKLIRTKVAAFVPAEWTGKNESQIIPVGDRVLVLPDQASELTQGIYIPEEVQERMSMAAETGVLVAKGEGAFLFNSDGTPYVGRKPEPGDRVFIERYAGQLYPGKDGKVYRLMDYKCIGAVKETE